MKIIIYSLTFCCNETFAPLKVTYNKHNHPYHVDLLFNLALVGNRIKLYEVPF